MSSNQTFKSSTARMMREAKQTDFADGGDEVVHLRSGMQVL